MKPMLAAKIDDIGLYLRTAKFPLIVQPKYDGIRCIISNGLALSRTLKSIPNRSLRAKLSILPHGLDGELWCEGMSYNEIQSIVMSEDKCCDDITYVVFDNFAHKARYSTRYGCLLDNDYGDFVSVTESYNPLDTIDFSIHEEHFISVGFEGIIIRDPDAYYKHGRSTLNEGTLLKYKRLDDAEARVLRVIELQHNLNPQERDERGYAKRSDHVVNKVGSGMAGSLEVEGLNGKYKGKIFCVSCGSMTHEEREWLWVSRDTLPGKTITYIFAATRGTSDAPAEPRIKCFRED